MRMEKQILEKYLHKNIQIILKNGFRYRGLLVEVTNISCCIKDIKVREVWLILDSISRVECLNEVAY